MTKNIFELPLNPEVIHDGIGLCNHAMVFGHDELQSPISFLNYTVLPVGATFGLHKHGDNNEFYVVLEGEGDYTSDGITERVTKGSIMVNPPFAVHGIKNTGSTELKVLVFEAFNSKN